MKSISGTSDDGGAGIAADDLSAALQGMTVTVEEGVMGCGDETHEPVENLAILAAE